MTENITNTAIENPLTKKMMLFYFVELASAATYSFLHGFSGLMWLAVLISFVGILPKLDSMAEKLPVKTGNLISMTCLILSSIIWGYIILYSLNSFPIIYTAILVARVIATIIAFKNIRDHVIVVLPLLIGFTLLKPAGCVPPLAF